MSIYDAGWLDMSNVNIYGLISTTIIFNVCLFIICIMRSPLHFSIFHHISRGHDIQSNVALSQAPQSHFVLICLFYLFFNIPQ